MFGVAPVPGGSACGHLGDLSNRISSISELRVSFSDCWAAILRCNPPILCLLWPDNHHGELGGIFFQLSTIRVCGEPL